jgi:hypothetical protein
VGFDLRPVDNPIIGRRCSFEAQLSGLLYQLFEKCVHYAQFSANQTIF